MGASSCVYVGTGSQAVGQHGRHDTVRKRELPGEAYDLATAPMEELEVAEEATNMWVAALYTSEPLPPRAISETGKQRVRMGRARCETRQKM